MTQTIPAPQSLDEAQHWLTLEVHFGDHPAEAGCILRFVRGECRTFGEPARRWLEGLINCPEVGGWARRILGVS